MLTKHHQHNFHKHISRNAHFCYLSTSQFWPNNTRRPLLPLVLHPSNFQYSILHCGSLVVHYDKNVIFFFFWKWLFRSEYNAIQSRGHETGKSASIATCANLVQYRLDMKSMKSVSNLFSITCSEAFEFRGFWTAICTRNRTEPHWISSVAQLGSKCDISKCESIQYHHQSVPCSKVSKRPQNLGSVEQRGSQRKLEYRTGASY